MDGYGVSPSSSSSSICEKYDVFLSFRGEDTRDNFTSHLYAALKRKQIKTYIDEEILQKGDDINLALPEAIQKSKIAIIIFSEDYASSTWCLRELEHILKCRRNNKQMVIPIFYRVNPSVIRKQEKSYEESFKRHENRFQDSKEMVEKWRVALTKSADLSGWDSQVTRPDTKLIEEVVEEVLKKLQSTVSSSADGLKGMIGMEERCEQLESLLSIGSANTCIISLWGMGGIGKTTLANAVYVRFFSHFESYCFLKNVREKSEEVHDGLEKLRNKLFAKLMGEKTVDLETPSSLEIIKRRLKKIRVLIVLDDVSKSEQLEHLVGDGDLFKSGSRILLTTRNQKFLRTIKGSDEVEISEYEVEKLNDSEALDLFNFTAFVEGKPPTPEYAKLSRQAVSYAGSIPLAIKVVGSELRSLREPNKEKWKMTLKKLKMSPHANIRKVLTISYEGLEKDEKNIFLDIACFFKGMQRDFVENILNACNFSASTGIDNLIDKSLITIDSHGNMLQMHDLVQDIGRDIVCLESEKPGKRSRLWIAEEIIQVLENNVGSANVQGLFLDYSKIDEDIRLEPTIFKKMCNLRLLKIDDHEHYKQRRIYLQYGLQYLPNSLRYLEWDHYPLESLPPNFKPKNLVELQMPYSQLKQLWDGDQVLKKLRGIDLSDSPNLTRIPDVSASPDLERINLEYCEFLREIPYSQIQQNLNNLIDVNLGCCDRLQNVPDRILDAASLRTLSLSRLNLLPRVITSRSLESLELSSIFNQETSSADNCEQLSNLSGLYNLNSLRSLRLQFRSNIKKLPVLPSNIEDLYIAVPTIKELDFQSIEDLKLEKLSIFDCKSLASLPRRIFELRFLSSLDLYKCKKLKNLPDISKPMESLTFLGIEKTAIEKLPSSFGNLTGLRRFRAYHCEYLEFDPEIIFNMPKLSGLYLFNCPQLGSFTFHGVDLEDINVRFSNIKKIPESIKDASKLRRLLLTDCLNLRSIPALPLSLEYLDASGCTLLEEVSKSEGALTQELENDYSMTKNTSIFYDCSKLGQTVLKNIIAEFQSRVLRIAARFASLGHQGKNLRVCTCCPGNEIPEWFDHQAEGCRIEINILPHNFLGFVLCAVGDARDVGLRSINDSSPFSLQLDLVCELNLKTNQGESYDRLSWLDRSGYTDGLPYDSFSDHLYMWFEPQDYSGYNYTDESVSFAFSFIEYDYRGNRDIAPPNCQVKKCGIHVLESKDLKKYNLTPSEAREKARNKSAATLDEPKSLGPTETDEFTSLDEPKSSGPRETDEFTTLDEPGSSSPTETDQFTILDEPELSSLTKTDQFTTLDKPESSIPAETDECTVRPPITLVYSRKKRRRGNMQEPGKESENMGKGC